MSTEETERQEVEIIRKVYSAGSTFGHAENVMHTLTHYKRIMSHDEAIALLHAEIVEGQ